MGQEVTCVMLDVGNVLGVVTVADLEPAVAWYERLFGRPPDRRPMENDVEWQLTSNGGLQLVGDEASSGKGYVTLGVADIEAALQDLASRGIEGTAEEVGAIDGVPLKIAQLQDPAGNTVVLASLAASRPS